MAPSHGYNGFRVGQEVWIIDTESDMYGQCVLIESISAVDITVKDESGETWRFYRARLSPEKPLKLPNKEQNSVPENDKIVQISAAFMPDSQFGDGALVFALSASGKIFKNKAGYWEQISGPVL